MADPRGPSSTYAFTALPAQTTAFQRQTYFPSCANVIYLTTTSIFGIRRKPKQPQNPAAEFLSSRYFADRFMAGILQRHGSTLHIAKANGSSLTFGRIFCLIIKELELDNFRSFSHARLDFVPGQNYIFGQNWQGKSSIVDAIGFALFGVAIFPKKVAGTAVTSDHLVNEASKHGAVELRFEQDGFEYSIHRSLPGGRVSLKKSDAEIAVGIRTVAEKLVALLGVDVKLFQNIFFSDQDDLRKSLEFSPEERRVFIERLLGVEEWKQRIESLRATRKALEEFLADLTSGRLGAFLTHIEELENEVASGQEELK